jgi:hypothetical protein
VIARQHAPHVREEQHREPELRAAQLHRLAAHGDALLARVEVIAADVEARGRLRRIRAPEKRLDACAEFGGAHRVGEEVVGAGR